MTTPTTSVSNLDIGRWRRTRSAAATSSSSWYLIDVEAGFELWQGGAGLATNSFSVNVAGGWPRRLLPLTQTPSTPTPTTAARPPTR